MEATKNWEELVLKENMLMMYMIVMKNLMIVMKNLMKMLVIYDIIITDVVWPVTQSCTTSLRVSSVSLCKFQICTNILC